MSTKKLLTLYHTYSRQIHLIIIFLVVVACIFIITTLIHNVVAKETETIAKDSAAAEPKMSIKDVVPTFLQNQMFPASRSAH